MSTVNAIGHTSRMLNFSVRIMSFLVSLGLFITLLFKNGTGITQSSWLWIGIFALICVVFYLVVGLRDRYVDPILLPVVLLINSIGLIFVYRIAVDPKSGLDDGDAIRQFVAFGLGISICIFLVLVLKDIRILRHYYWTSMVIGIVLLLVPAIPGVGREINGAQLWVSVAGFQFQPAEFAKIFLLLFFAGFLVERRDSLALAGPTLWGLRFPRFRDMGPIVLVWGVSLIVLVMERDLGTSLLFFGLFIAMLYVATSKISWVLIGLVLFAVGIAIAYVSFAHFQARVEVWLNPADPVLYDRFPGGSYQIMQGLFALANGGLFGVGIGSGYPTLTPFADSDYIFSVLGEELGLIGIAGILLLFTFLVLRIIRQGLAIRDGYGKLLAAGIGFLFALQMFVVVGGILRVIPLTGLTLPFISRGGSALIVNWILIAIVIVLSNQARQPFEVPQTGESSSAATSLSGNSLAGSSSTGNSSTANSLADSYSTGNSLAGSSFTGNSSTGNSSAGSYSTGNSITGSATTSSAGLNRQEPDSIFESAEVMDGANGQR
jgi:cell division protein FtsW (lipid II flippase)